MSHILKIGLASMLFLLLVMVTAYAEPANTYVYVCSHDSKTISVMSPVTMQIITDIKVNGMPYYVEVNPAGTVLAVSYNDDNYHYIDFYSTVDYSLISSVYCDNVTGIDFDDKGKKLYVAQNSTPANKICIIDMDSYTISHTKIAGDPQWHTGRITYYNGYVYVVARTFGTIIKLDADNVTYISSSPAPIFSQYSYSYSMVVDRENNKIIVSGNNGTLWGISPDTLTLVTTYDTGSDPSFYVFGADVNSSGYVFAGIYSVPGTIAVFNPSGTRIASYTSSNYSGITDITLNPYNNTLYLATYYTNKFVVVNSDTGELVANGNMGIKPLHITIGTQTYPGNHAATITVQSLFGTIKLENVVVTLYDNNNILQYTGTTDSTGSCTFYVNPTTRYKVIASNASQGINESGYITPGASSYQFNVPFTTVLSTWLGFNGLTADTFIENQSTYIYTLDNTINRTSGDAWINVTYAGASTTTAITFYLYKNNTTSLMEFVGSAGYLGTSAFHNFSLSNAAGNSYLVVYNVSRSGLSNQSFYSGCTFPGPKVIPGFPLNWYYWFGFIPLFLLYGAGTITRKGPIALMGAAWMAIATGFGWFSLYVSDTAMGMCIVIAILLGVLMWISEQQQAHTVGGIKTMQITVVILLFSLLTAMFSFTGALPNVNTAAATSIDKGALDQLTSTQTISSDDPSGYAGLFVQGVKILFTIGQIIIGTLVVGIPLMNIGVPWWIALAVVQPVLWALVAFDMLTLWRGITWN